MNLDEASLIGARDNVLRRDFVPSTSDDDGVVVAGGVDTPLDAAAVRRDVELTGYGSDEAVVLGLRLPPPAQGLLVIKNVLDLVLEVEKLLQGHLAWLQAV